LPHVVGSGLPLVCAIVSCGSCWFPLIPNTSQRMRRFLLRKPLQRLPPHPKGGQKPKDNGDDALFLPTGIVFRPSVQKKTLLANGKTGR
jgi:hypothetical protein